MRSFKLFFLLAFCISTIQAQELPGDLSFKRWEDQTAYQKTYHVSQNHPKASDQNPGTLAAPLKSISKAAELAKAGEKIIIHSGVYREQIRPKNGGTGPKAMISYEAAKGEKVTISGSVMVDGTWESSTHPNGTLYSLNNWQIPLTEALEESQGNPFLIPNTTDYQMEVMNWATHLTGTVPYTLKRGMVFQDKKRLIQLSSYADLARIDGAFWVDTARALLHINPYGFVNPNETSFEVTQHEQLFVPEYVGTPYLKIKGLHFEHAGNGFMRTGVGAIFNKGGHHWIIEENEISGINSVALEIGMRFTEERDITAEEKALSQTTPGGHLVRKNTIHNCGTGGIQGLRNTDVLVEENHLYNIGWQDTENYWECAAIKLLVCRRTLVQKNRIHDIMAANAVWLDWDNENCRVTKNLIYDMQPAMGGAIYVEASRSTPNWIDNNILYKISNIAISVYDSDYTVTFNNLIAKAELPYISKVNTTGRKVDGRLLTSENNELWHNIFYHNKQAPSRESESNQAHYNLFVGESFKDFEKEAWGKGNFQMELDLKFNPEA
ncbi:MAG: right-handed parallel beta-helix repeat-containing protein, partial [Bacteroidota bacterium]